MRDSSHVLETVSRIYVVTMSEYIRPWGHYEVLETLPTHQVKRMIIQSGHRVSLQYHERRAEHWIIISGRGLVQLGDREQDVCPGDYICIPPRMLHRAKCVSEESLVFIEVWTGSYFGEDDIVRLEDDYARPTH